MNLFVIMGRWIDYMDDTFTGREAGAIEVLVYVFMFGMVCWYFDVGGWNVYSYL
jgi:hypothetical protein